MKLLEKLSSFFNLPFTFLHLVNPVSCLTYNHIIFQSIITFATAYRNRKRWKGVSLVLCAHVIEKAKL